MDINSLRENVAHPLDVFYGYGFPMGNGSDCLKKPTFYYKILAPSTRISVNFVRINSDNQRFEAVFPGGLTVIE